MKNFHGEKEEKSCRYLVKRVCYFRSDLRSVIIWAEWKGGGVSLFDLLDLINARQTKFFVSFLFLYRSLMTLIRLLLSSVKIFRDKTHISSSISSKYKQERSFFTHYHSFSLKTVPIGYKRLNCETIVSSIRIRHRWLDLRSTKENPDFLLQLGPSPTHCVDDWWASRHIDYRPWNVSRW